jgi:hypothetical protein
MAGGEGTVFELVTEKGAAGRKVYRKVAVGEDTYKAHEAAALARANKREKAPGAPRGNTAAYKAQEAAGWDAYRDGVRRLHEPEGVVRFVISKPSFS